MDHDKWQWQEPGTAWRGVGLYHITLTVTSRQPLLGTLVIPNNDPAQARVDVSPFGRTLTNLLWDISKYQPDIQMLHYALMPDHLHFIWYVKRPLTRSIREVVSGFWVGAKKLGRAYSYDDSSFESTSSRHNYQESLCDQIGKDAYYALDPIFTQMPHIQPMGHNSQLPATIDYLDMNPQRLAATHNPSMTISPHATMLPAKAPSWSRPSSHHGRKISSVPSSKRNARSSTSLKMALRTTISPPRSSSMPLPTIAFSSSLRGPMTHLTSTSPVPTASPSTPWPKRSVPNSFFQLSLNRFFHCSDY